MAKSIVKPGTYTSLFPVSLHQEWLKNASHIRHLDVFETRPRVERRNQRPQLQSAVGLGICERLTQDGFTVLRGHGEFFQAQRLDAAFRQIPRHLMFPGGLESFHFERFQAHARAVYLK